MAMQRKPRGSKRRDGTSQDKCSGKQDKRGYFARRYASGINVCRRPLSSGAAQDEWQRRNDK